MEQGIFRFKVIILWLTLALTFSCASKSPKFDSPESLSARLSKSQAWRNYDPAKKEDVVFTALINRLELGYGYLTGRNYLNAYYTFDSILSDPRYVKYEEYRYAKFYLAQALDLLGVKYGALLYFTDILKKEEDMPYLEESLRRAISISQHLKDDSLILYLATVLTGDRIPESMREEFRFFIAKNFYLKNTFKNAGILFKAITPNNRLFLLSQYYLGVMSVQRDRFKRALNHFSTIASVENPAFYYENEGLIDLSNMNIARVLFEAGLLKKSVEYYGEIGKGSDLYPQALYESSWALYNWGKFNAALSTLHSLQSPFYEITFFPRSILLKGAIFLELCMYRDAILALKNLEEYYAELKGLMDSFYSQAKSRADYYRLLTGAENLPGDSPENPYRKLFQLASANRDFLQMHRFVKMLNSELKILAKLSDNKRAVFLSEHIQNKKSKVTKKAMDLAIEKIQLTRKAIADYLRTADVVRLEITTAERKLLEDKVKGYGRADSTDINIPSPMQSSVYIQDNYYFYKFQGEYWKDEIGYYLYNIESQCLAKDLR